MTALLAIAVVHLPADLSATWRDQVRGRLAGVMSLTAEFTKTETAPHGSRRAFDCRLRMARRPAGSEWVGDLRVQSEGGSAEVWTLWGGVVYQADPAWRMVNE